jgi:hypothetical protein
MSLSYEFDHLVVIGRDQMSKASECFQALGFYLTPLARHNLGSMNRLIVLRTAYIELLGWEAGEPPARKEIANEPIGLNALVFRTQDAEACYAALADFGYSPNPVQELTRPVKIGDKIEQASFRTVRFSEQPIPGLRIYFCQHLTPQYVWRAEDMSHPNKLSELAEIVIESSNPQALDSKLRALLLVGPERTSVTGLPPDHQIALGNCRLRIVASDTGKLAALKSCRIESAQAGAFLSFGSEILQQ